MRVAIVGFGLIGASIGLAVRERISDGWVGAVDFREALTQPKARAAAHAHVALDDAPQVAALFSSSDLVVVSTPVNHAAPWIRRALEDAPLVTDCGSTKRAIVEGVAGASRRQRFVAGHPMAGGSLGVEGARADLFEGKRWLLCPEGAAPDALDAVRGFVGRLGAAVHCLSAAEHDRAVAWTSHLPQLLASAVYALAVEERTLDAAGPSFRSATRVAAGTESMWRPIFETNADTVSHALGTLSEELRAVAQALERGDVEPALTLLRRANEARKDEGIE